MSRGFRAAVVCVLALATGLTACGSEKNGAVPNGSDTLTILSLIHI